jgi:hypothetical protein
MGVKIRIDRVQRQHDMRITSEVRRPNCEYIGVQQPLLKLSLGPKLRVFRCIWLFRPCAQISRIWQELTRRPAVAAI